MKVTAFCPGHVTGFFQICEHKEPMRSGSRGAGLCLSLGAESIVDTEEGNGDILIILDGKEERAPVTRTAVEKILGERKLDVTVITNLDLPVSQGFGMSAAGALSAAHALSESLQLPFKYALRAAHEAEIESHTGLGDVAALSRGGITYRRIEGLPPYGRIDRVNAEPDIVLCVVGDPLETSAVLGDTQKRAVVNRVGKDCVEKMAIAPTLANLMRLSREFMKRTGLATKEVEAAVTAAEDFGPASMTMLGNSAFAVGNAREQEKVLASHGKTYKAKVDWRGPRIMESTAWALD
jgi:pantoate kinase